MSSFGALPTTVVSLRPLFPIESQKLKFLPSNRLLSHYPRVGYQLIAKVAPTAAMVAVPVGVARDCQLTRYAWSDRSLWSWSAVYSLLIVLLLHEVARLLSQSDSLR